MAKGAIFARRAAPEGAGKSRARSKTRASRSCCDGLRTNSKCRPHYALSGNSAGIADRSFLIHVPNTSFTNSSTSLCGRCSVTRAAAGSPGWGRCPPSPVMDADRAKALSATDNKSAIAEIERTFGPLDFHVPYYVVPDAPNLNPSDVDEDNIGLVTKTAFWEAAPPATQSGPPRTRVRFHRQ